MNRRGGQMQSKSDGYQRHVVRRGDDECWGWNGWTNGAGYGMFSSFKQKLLAHRISYELAFGPIPEGKMVCHTCDNRICTNPRHLWLGSSADNVRDMHAKGRASKIRARGERTGAAKLTTSQVLRIRDDTRRNTTIAIEYGVSDALVGQIKRRKAWRHV